ncbi:MAG: nucleotide exchange factor GrpE [Epulopiscium sp.]|nr:nucleotide exchange factor GrpE [Candidatus Epulonipiscium sp.]
MFWLANPKQAEDTIKAWENTLGTFDEIMIEEIKSCFFSIRVKIIIKILQHFHKDHRLAMHDQEIFPFLEQLMCQYKRIINDYTVREGTIGERECIEESDTKRDEEQEVTDIIEGMMSLLLSEYQQFYENGKLGINPIQLEKEKYISYGKQDFISKLQKIEQDFIQQWVQEKNQKRVFKQQWMQKNRENQKEIYMEQIQQLYDSIWNQCSQSIYTLYQSSTIEGMEQMDDFNKRPMLHFYYEFAQNQKSTLESICSIQLQALKRKMREGNHEISFSKTIEQLIHSIQALYIQTQEKIYFWEQGFKKGIDPKEKIMGLSSFHEYIQKEGIEKYLQDKEGMTIERIEEYWTKFQEAFQCFQIHWEIIAKSYEEFFSQWVQKESHHWKEEIVTEEERYEQMLKNILEAFQQFQEYYKEQEPILLETEYKDIFMGIDETLSIKIQSIEEQHEEWKAQIQKYGEKNNEEMTKKQMDLTLPLYQQWIQEEAVYQGDTPFRLSFLEYVFKKDQEEGYMKKEQDQWMERKKNVQQQWVKMVTRHLKNNLLFEMSTFEEILHYSISRLRGETEKSIQQYVDKMDELTQNLHNALEAYGITFITPKPHEKFNGKEQEVLLAEENEAFQKGEVIQCINTGYKYQDQVLLRANVIAAR